MNENCCPGMGGGWMQFFLHEQTQQITYSCVENFCENQRPLDYLKLHVALEIPCARDAIANNICMYLK